MPVTARTLRLQRKLEADLAKITDAQTRTLVAAWADAWDECAPDLTATLLDLLTAGGHVTRAQLLRSERLRRALTVVAGNLSQLADQAGVTIVGDLQQVIDTAGGAQASVIDSQLPPRSTLVDALAWSRVDEKQIAAIVKRSTQQITSRTRPLSAEAYQAVRRELLRGVAAGSNPKVTARRIVARTEGRFNGGLARALTIARTETLDAHRAAAQLAQEAQADVLAGWVWLADLTGRVCPACLSQHGTRHPVTDPGPLGHQNCVLPGAVVAGPRALASTTRWFAGEVIDIETRSGRVLSVTPNHPILTPNGWVAAGELVEGDDVLAGAGTDGPAFKRCPDDHQVPALIQDVAETLGGALPVRAVSVPTSPEDFHGDGSGSHVHVVRTHSLLRDDVQAAAAELVGELELMLRDVGLQTLTGRSSLRQLLQTPRPPADSLVSGSRVGAVLLGRPCGHHDPVRFGLVAPGGAGLVEHLAEVGASDAKVGGHRLDGVASRVPLDYPMPNSEELARFAGAVSHDVVLRLRRRSWAGHVYNLQTETGWFLANGILTHNCRCSRMPVTKTWAQLGIHGVDEPEPLIPSAQAWFDGLDDGEQRRILGPARLEAYRSGVYPMSSWATRHSTPGWRDSYRVSALPNQRTGRRAA